MGRLFRERFLLKRRGISSHIRRNRRCGVFGCVSTVLLFALIISILSPVYFALPNTEATTKDPVPSTLAFNSTSNTASVVLNVDNPSGTFNSSANDGTNASFSISTNNATGYTVSLKVDDNGATSLSNGTDSISTISTAGITADNFATNTWGILPSKYNSANNTMNYYPASTTGFIMDETSAANATANNYTVGLGIKTDFTTPTGTYTNSAVVVEYVANPVTYSISYSKNANVTTITGMPSPNPQGGTISQGTTAASVTLASAPERTGYTFIGWCRGTSSSTNTTTTDGVDVCGNAATNQFEAGQSFGIDATGTSPDTYYLYAMWSANSYTCTKQYRLQNADGTWGEYVADGTEQIKYGATCSYSKTVANYKGSANATNNSAATTSGVMNSVDGITVSLDLYRNTFTCLIRYQLQNANGSYATAVTGTNSTLRYGETCAWSRAADATYKAASYSTTITADINQTVSVDRNPVTCNKQYRLENADGSFPTSYTADGSETILYGGSCSYSKTVTDYKGSANGANGSAGTMTVNNVTSTQTLSVSLYRNTYTLTVTAGANTSGATGGGSKKWGESVTVGVTKAANTTCITYATPTWTATAGTAPAAGASSTYTMPKSNATVTASSTASNIAQTITFKTVDATNITLNNNTKTNNQTLSIACGNYSISGTFPTDYNFQSWSATAGSFGSASTLSTTYTVAGSATITLTGKPGQCASSASCMQKVTASTCGNNLTDARDGQVYGTTKLVGLCWMTKNLNLAGGTTVTPSLSHVTSNYTLPASSITGFNDLNGGTYKAFVYNSGNTNCNNNTQTLGCYSYYSFVAATAGTGGQDLASQTDAPSDICPAGWRLPKIDEFTALQDSWNTGPNGTNCEIYDSYLDAPFYGVHGGQIYNGTRSGNNAYLWSSTTLWEHSAYRFNFATCVSNTYNTDRKYYGDSVRCVADI